MTAPRGSSSLQEKGTAMSANPASTQTDEPARTSAPHRASGSNKRYRSESVTVRFTPDEYEEVQRLAEVHGVSVPELLRSCLCAAQMSEARRG